MYWCDPMSNTRTSDVFYPGTGIRVIEQNKKHNINVIIQSTVLIDHRESINDVFNCSIKITYEITHNLCNLLVLVTLMYEIFLDNSYFH